MSRRRLLAKLYRLPLYVVLAVTLAVMLGMVIGGIVQFGILKAAAFIGVVAGGSIGLSALAHGIAALYRKADELDGEDRRG